MMIQIRQRTPNPINAEDHCHSIVVYCGYDLVSVTLSVGGK